MTADKIVIEVDLGNAAMRTPTDVLDALHRSFGRNGDDWRRELEAGDEGRLRDENGNTVGSWRVA